MSETEIEIKNTEVMSRVRDAAEEAICDLFNHPLNDETEVNLPYIIYDSDEPKHLRVKIYRSSIELRPVNYDALKSLSYSRYHLSKYNAQLAGKDLWTCLSLAVRELYGKINIGIENRHATEALFYFAVDLHPRERIPLNWAFVKAYLLSKRFSTTVNFDQNSKYNSNFYDYKFDFEEWMQDFDQVENLVEELPEIDHNKVKEAIEPYIKHQTIKHNTLDGVKFRKAGYEEKICGNKYYIDHKAV
uniref:BTB domain-containing protein n=1 Tax=Meloidogyne hapla TaxID=6305 RepID=A0A1I8BVT2_MELHA